MPFEIPDRLFESPTQWTTDIPQMLALCDHFAGKPLTVGYSATNTLEAARQYAADMLRPSGSPHLWLVQVEDAPGEIRTLAVGGNCPEGEATVRFIAIAATLLPKVLTLLLPLAEAEAAEEARHEQPDELSMEAICYDI